MQGASCRIVRLLPVDVETGVISRLAGEVFGSAATFGAVKKHLRRKDKYR